MDELIPLTRRELRNQCGEVLRRVSAGSSFLVTDGGRPVGRLVPLDAPATGLRLTQPATRRGGWAALVHGQQTRTGDLERIVDELREDHQ